MKLTIVRHAESKGNASGDYSVATHDSLSPSGWKQAACLAERLRLQAFDKILVSPLQRAMATIFPYLSATRRRAEIWPEIAEACWQEQREEPGTFWSMQPACVPTTMEKCFRYLDDQAIKPAANESFGEGLRRVHATADRLQSMAFAPDCSFLMITHGHFMRELLNLLLGPHDPATFHHDNCGMTSLTFDGAWSMQFCNRQINIRPSHKSDAGNG